MTLFSFLSAARTAFLDRGRQGGFSASIWRGCRLMNIFIYVVVRLLSFPKVFVTSPYEPVTIKLLLSVIIIVSLCAYVVI